MLDQTSEPAWVIAPLSGRLLAATPAGRRQLGLSPDDQALPHHFDRAMPAIARLAELARSGHGEHSERLLFWGPRGPVSMLCVCRRLETSEAVPVFLVTAPQCDPARIDHRGTPAAAATDPVSERLLAELAHELRTPLGAVLSLAEFMRDERFGPLDARYRDYAGDIHRSTRHALAIVNAMLDRDRLAGGQPSLEFTELDLVDIAEECAAMARPMANAASIALRLVPGDRLPHVIADGRTVRQMLTNLLTNAIRASPLGGKVDLRLGHAADGTVIVSVDDEGPGIPDAVISRLLADAPHQQPGEGSPGIGLPLVRTLAAANGAALSLLGGRPSGTRATITFARDRVVPV